MASLHITRKEADLRSRRLESKGCFPGVTRWMLEWQILGLRVIVHTDSRLQINMPVPGILIEKKNPSTAADTKVGR